MHALPDRERQVRWQRQHTHQRLYIWHSQPQIACSRFPEGTKLKELRTKENAGIVAFSGSYILDDKEFFISICSSVDAPNSEVEINEPNVETYIVEGIEHHIMSDVRQNKATWVNGEWECYIAGNVEKAELIMMIDSIYE